VHEVVYSGAFGERVESGVGAATAAASVRAIPLHRIGSGHRTHTIGQLSESWQHLEDLLAHEDRAVGYHLVWLADVIRAIGHRTVGGHGGDGAARHHSPRCRDAALRLIPESGAMDIVVTRELRKTHSQRFGPDASVLGIKAVHAAPADDGDPHGLPSSQTCCGEPTADMELLAYRPEPGASWVPPTMTQWECPSCADVLRSLKSPSSTGRDAGDIGGGEVGAGAVPADGVAPAAGAVAGDVDTDLANHVRLYEGDVQRFAAAPPS
jgi:hypothetical protein